MGSQYGRRTNVYVSVFVCTKTKNGDVETNTWILQKIILG